MATKSNGHNITGGFNGIIDSSQKNLERGMSGVTNANTGGKKLPSTSTSSNSDQSKKKSK